MRRLPPGSFSLLILALLACTVLACPGLASTSQPFVPSPVDRDAPPETKQIEANIRFLEARLKSQNARLEAIAGTTVGLIREQRAREADIATLTGRLRAMLPRLWEMDVALKGLMQAPAAPWDEADRNLNWLGAVYGQALEDTSRLRLLESELSANQARQAEIKLDAQLQAALTEKTKDALLAERLKLLRETIALRQEKFLPPDMLERILELILQADLSPASTQERTLKAAKGLMPWPVKGSLASGFDPEADPARNGIVLAAPAQAKILAVHWGRVAFAGAVRGLGQVVVLAHGEEALTVYAHLARLEVKAGQEVARGDMLGTPGKIAPGGASGMSFELRFGAKPINPSRWLSAG